MSHQWNLSAEEFGAALGRGLGRALIYTQQSELTDNHRRALVEASLDPLDDGYNWDDEMAPWLLDAASAGGMLDSLAAAVLQAASDEERDEDRVAALLKELAHRGNHAARSALYSIIRRNLSSDSPTPGWDSAVALDGPQAFVKIGANACSTPNLVGKLVAELSAEEREAVQVKLSSLALDSTSREGLRKAIQAAQMASTGRRPDRKAWIRSRTLQDVVEDAKGQHRGWLMAWGKVASEKDLSELADRLFGELTPQQLKRLLLVFTARPLATFDERFLILVDHADESVRHRALRIVGQYQSPLVRKLALDRLEAGLHDGNTVWLLSNNYDPGDHTKLQPLFVGDKEPKELHDVGYDLLHVFDNHPSAELSPLVEKVYEMTPCSLCRERAVESLLREGFASPWLLEECRYDAVPAIRELLG